MADGGDKIRWNGGKRGKDERRKADFCRLELTFYEPRSIKIADLFCSTADFYYFCSRYGVCAAGIPASACASAIRHRAALRHLLAERKQKTARKLKQGSAEAETSRLGRRKKAQQKPKKPPRHTGQAASAAGKAASEAGVSRLGTLNEQPHRGGAERPT